MGETPILSNHSLTDYNTFGVDVPAKQFARFRSTNQLISYLSVEQNIFLLGGGSNLLLTQAIDALVLKNEIYGIQIIEQSKREAIVKCGGGEVWDDLVAWSVSMGFGGLENLSLIPGCVGTAPIQNIGAYGVELKDVMHSLEAIEISSGGQMTFSNKDCEFGYRDSIFKHNLKGKYCITSVTFRLTKREHHLKLDYGSIKEHLVNKGIDKPTIGEVRTAVIDIRNSKLPNPEELGNSGSFFKNPIVNQTKIDDLLKSFPDIIYYPQENGQFKIPAAWLIQHTGLKGSREGDAGIYENHALVLVNHGTATGKELFDFAMKVQSGVEAKFGITLHPEVNII